MAVAREEDFRDLYEILGVPRGADEETLRNAYRVRARQLHPDVSKEPDAEERFRELSHAYDVLSKPRSRLLYDRLAYRGPGGGGFGPAHEGVGRPTKDSAHLSEDELIGWIFTEDMPDPGAPVPREDRLLRVMAAIALAIAIVLIVVVLFR
jgi:curved DNA-binding protein CbpA